MTQDCNNAASNESNPSYPIITIDGPSGAGKGTVAWRLAKELGFQLLDSGALYRIVGLKAFEAGLLDRSDTVDEEAVTALTRKLTISFKPNEATGNVDILVNGTLIGVDIRNETVGGYASVVAVFPKVRKALLKLQQEMAQQGGVIADGRDMGTVVFPEADAKIFLTASSEARAKRRVEQLQGSGQIADYETILATIKDRDIRDETRSASPSKPADDALIIDSSSLDAEQVYETVKTYCQAQGLCFSR